MGPTGFGLPASALRDERVPLDELWPWAEAARLAERIAAVPAVARA